VPVEEPSTASKADIGSSGCRLWSRPYYTEASILKRLLNRLKPKERRGSKPRCHLLKHGSPDVVAKRLAALETESGPRELQIAARIDFAARPASQHKPPTAAKKTAAIQSPDSEILFVNIATKIVSAAIPHVNAIPRPTP